MSGRISDLVTTPSVAASMSMAASAGTLHPSLVNQVLMVDCLRPIARPRAVCPPRRSIAFLSAFLSIEMIINAIALLRKRKCGLITNKRLCVNLRMALGKNVKKRREALGLTQEELADAIGKSQSVISSLEGRDSRSSSHIYAIAKALRTTADELMDGTFKDSDLETVAPGPDIKGLVPLIDWVAAGGWAEGSDLFEVGDAEKWMACPVSHGHRTFVLRVSGPSMDDGTPDGYPDGHLIYVDPDRAYKHNDDVIVKNGDGRTTFKRLVCQGNDCWLKPLNEDWPEPIIPVDEHCQIIGVVIFSGKER